jgi:hypothetical protein
MSKLKEYYDSEIKGQDNYMLDIDAVIDEIIELREYKRLNQERKKNALLSDTVNIYSDNRS